MFADGTDKPLKTAFQALPHVYVNYYLKVYEASAERMVAEVARQQFQDTLLRLGTRLLFGTCKMIKEFEDDDRIQLYFIDVYGSQTVQNRLIHVFSPIFKDIRHNFRKESRQDIRYAIACPSMFSHEGQTENLSLKGLKFKIQMPGMSQGLVLDSVYSLILKGHVEVTVSARVKHVHYDYHHEEQVIGLAFEDLNPSQTQLIEQLLNPQETKVLEDEDSMVDPEKAKITKM